MTAPMRASKASLALWREWIAQARSGDEQPLLRGFLLPISETNTREMDVNGKRIVEYTWREVPGEIRQELFEILSNPPPAKRGRKRLEPFQADLMRFLHATDTAELHVFAEPKDATGVRVLRNNDRMSKTASKKRLAKDFGVSVDTVRDVIKHRKTYAGGRKK